MICERLFSAVVFFGTHFSPPHAAQRWNNRTDVNLSLYKDFVIQPRERCLTSRWQRSGGTAHLELNFTQSLTLRSPQCWGAEASEHIPSHLPPGWRLLFASTHQTHPNQILAWTRSRNSTTCTLQVDVFSFGPWAMFQEQLPLGGGRGWHADGNEEIFVTSDIFSLTPRCGNPHRVWGCGRGGKVTNLSN